jgi:hypothetical protein
MHLPAFNARLFRLSYVLEISKRNDAITLGPTKDTDVEVTRRSKTTMGIKSGNGT